MSAVKRYAEGTTVPVERSRAEVMALLQKHGVTAMGWQRLPEGGDAIGFQIRNQQYRFTVTAPSVEEMQKRLKRESPNRHVQYSEWPRIIEAETRRRWRAAILLMKAKFEAIAGDDTTLAREFMAYLVLEDGRTVEQAVEADALPLLTAGGAQ